MTFELLCLIAIIGFIGMMLGAKCARGAKTILEELKHIRLVVEEIRRTVQYEENRDKR